MDLSTPNLTALVDQAKKLYEESEYEQAAALFEKIYQQYAAAGDEVNCAENKNNASVALLKADQAQKSLDTALGTDLVFAKAGDKVHQAMALGNQAAAIEALGDLDKALEVYQQASALLKEAGEQDLRSYVLKSISSIKMRKGKYMESMASMQAAIGDKKSPSLVERILKKLLGFIFKN
jgi:tetratricopeptide (TPR) repeat protein